MRVRLCAGSGVLLACHIIKRLRAVYHDSSLEFVRLRAVWAIYKLQPGEGLSRFVESAGVAYSARIVTEKIL